MRRGLLVSILALAGGVRLLSAPAIRPGDPVALVGGPDAFFHLRRAECAAAGRLAPFDAWTNYPFGQGIHWPTLYDIVLGAFLREGGVAGAMLVPVFIGVAAVAALAPWAVRLLGPSAPYALLVLALAPAAAYPTVLGAIDHHGLETLALVAAGAAVAVVGGGVGRLAFVAAAASACGAAVAPAAASVGFVAALALLLRTGPARLATAALAATPVAVAAGMLFVVRDLRGGDDWLVRAAELKPMLTAPVDLPRVVVALSPGVLLLPLAAGLWWRRRRDASAAAALAAAAVAFPMALLGERFVTFLVVPSALAAAEAAAWAAGRYGRAVAAALAALALLPPARGITEIPTWRPDPSPAVAAALLVLRGVTPPAGDPFDAATRPAYGVAAAWDLGHHIVALGRRPAVANAFHGGDRGRALSREILFKPPAEATRAADAARVRVLFLTDLARTGYAESYRGPGRSLAGTLYGRLYLFGDETLGWRRLHASAETFDFEGRRVPEVQVWERGGEGRGRPVDGRAGACDRDVALRAPGERARPTRRRPRPAACG